MKTLGPQAVRSVSHPTAKLKPNSTNSPEARSFISPGYLLHGENSWVRTNVLITTYNIFFCTRTFSITLQDPCPKFQKLLRNISSQKFTTMHGIDQLICSPGGERGGNLRVTPRDTFNNTYPPTDLLVIREPRICKLQNLS